MEKDISGETLVRLYREMLRIRKFEERVVRLYAEGFIPGHVHLCNGQEPIAAGISAHLRCEDYVFTTHRPHGHLLAKGARADRMLAEVLAKADGYNRGKGGHMHIFAGEVHGFADGIVGWGFGVSTGTGLAQKIQGGKAVTVCYFGDGAANQGALYESMNMAALWKLPILYVCEDNQYAISTPTSVSRGGPGYADRAEGFGIAAARIDGYRVEEVYEAAAEAVARAREGGGATFMDVKTYRLRGHREGDPQGYRTKEEVAEWRKRDPVAAFRSRLLEAKAADEAGLAAMADELEKEMDAAEKFAKDSPYPEMGEALLHVYAEGLL